MRNFQKTAWRYSRVQTGRNGHTVGESKDSAERRGPRATLPFLRAVPCSSPQATLAARRRTCSRRWLSPSSRGGKRAPPWLLAAWTRSRRSSTGRGPRKGARSRRRRPTRRAQTARPTLPASKDAADVETERWESSTLPEKAPPPGTKSSVPSCRRRSRGWSGWRRRTGHVARWYNVNGGT